MSLIRVGFRAPGQFWQGGRNYLWNLLYAIGQQPERAIDPVVLARIPADVDEYRAVAEVTPPTILDRNRLPFFAGRTAMHLAGIDVVEWLAMQRARAELYSHAPPLGKRFGLPWIYWIPDMQVVRLPGLFGPLATRKYTSEMRSGLESARLVIVSSHVTKRDVLEIFGARHEKKLRVLQFVAQPRTPTAPTRAALHERYRIPPRYFALPNQFWKHKNHEVVVEALARARDVSVVATGATHDSRHPQHFEQLVARAERLGVADRFRVLGAIPFADMIGVVTHSVAVINPSLFEGWSTTVEEARTLGKRLVLSDIDVHREQAPPRARYFPANDSAELAAQLEHVWRESDDGDTNAAADAARSLPVRTLAFARTYEAIVREALTSRS